MGNRALMSSRDRDTKSNYKAPGPGLQELVHMENRRTLFYCLSLNIPWLQHTFYIFLNFSRLISINPLNDELNPICHFLALLAHHILHISRIMVNDVTEKTCADLTGPDEFFTSCDSLIFLLIHRTAWNKLCKQLLFPSSQWIWPLISHV
jgi:hypothetical protein